jgi:Spy/CpxP family protein refolding chaperone
MFRQTAWVLSAALALCVPASAAALCEHEDTGAQTERDQRGGQRGEQRPGEQRPADQRPADPRSDGRGAQEHRPFKFWQGDTQTALGITNQQSAEIEQIFQATFPKLEKLKDKLDKVEATLSQTIRDNTADLDTVALQVDRQESVRAELYKTRTLMLYRMRLILSADQRAKLQARWEADHRKPSDASGRR